MRRVEPAPSPIAHAAVYGKHMVAALRSLTDELGVEIQNVAYYVGSGGMLRIKVTSADEVQRIASHVGVPWFTAGPKVACRIGLGGMLARFEAVAE